MVDEEDFALRSGIAQLGRPQIWRAFTEVLAVLLAFRVYQSWGRFWEGTGLLHQMRGEWFDAVSCLVVFSRSARHDMPQEVKMFRHTLVRLTSLMHGCALHELEDFQSVHFEVLDMKGLDRQTLQHLRFCRQKGFNLVEVILHQIQVLVTETFQQKILRVDPPILSRVYQQFSRGVVNLHNAKKITDTPFPFPYAQLLVGVLWLHAILTPIFMASFTQAWYWTVILTFVPVCGMHSLNLIACAIEMPFGDDDNDLPLQRFQLEMNKSLLILMNEFGDVMPCSRATGARDFASFKSAIKLVHIPTFDNSDLTFL